MDPSEVKRMLEVARRIESICPVASRKQEPKPEELFHLLVTESELNECCRKLFMDGHYANAVLEAYKCLNNYVRTKVASSEDGSDLMKKVFSAKSPELRISRFRGKSNYNEQLGYMEIYSGCMTGIRNPRAHEHAHKDAPEEALELIILANHLMRKAKQAKRVRRKRNSTHG